MGTGFPKKLYCYPNIDGEAFFASLDSLQEYVDIGFHKREEYVDVYASEYLDVLTFVHTIQDGLDAEIAVYRDDSSTYYRIRPGNEDDSGEFFVQYAGEEDPSVRRIAKAIIGDIRTGLFSDETVRKIGANPEKIVDEYSLSLEGFHPYPGFVDMVRKKLEDFFELHEEDYVRTKTGWKPRRPRPYAGDYPY